MHISDEGLVAGSVNRAQLAAAYSKATDRAVRVNLAAVGAEHGMYVEGGRLIDPSAPEPEPEPAPKSPAKKTAAKAAADTKEGPDGDHQLS